MHHSNYNRDKSHIAYVTEKYYSEIAPNNKSTYCTAIQQMLIFLDKYFLKAELVDFTVEKIVLFTAYLFEEGKSPNTISTYLAALSYYLKFKGKPDITRMLKMLIET
jgi:hypothetical protein